MTVKIVSVNGIDAETARKTGYIQSSNFARVRRTSAIMGS
jgi:hypothetical protein